MSSESFNHNSTNPIIIAGGGPTGIFILLKCLEKGLPAELHEASGILGGAPALGGDCLSNRPIAFNWGDYSKKVGAFWEKNYPEVNISEHFSTRSILFQDMLSSFVHDGINADNIHINSPVHEAEVINGHLVVDVNGIKKNASKLILATGHQWNMPVHDGFRSVLGEQYYASPWLSNAEIKSFKKNSRVLLLGGSNGAADFAKTVYDAKRDDLTLTMATADGAGFRPLTMDMLDVDMDLINAKLSQAQTPSDVVSIFNNACNSQYPKTLKDPININPFIVAFSKSVKEKCPSALKELSDRFIKMAGRIISPDMMNLMKDMGHKGKLRQVFSYVTPNDISYGSILLAQSTPMPHLKTLDSLDTDIFQIDGSNKPFDYVVNTSPFARGLLLDEEKKPVQPLLRAVFNNGLVSVTGANELTSESLPIIIANPSFNRDTLFSVARSIETANHIAHKL